MELISVTTAYGVFGIVANADGIVIRAAPMARWTIGKPISEAINYYSRRGATIEHFKTEAIRDVPKELIDGPSPKFGRSPEQIAPDLTKARAVELAGQGYEPADIARMTGLTRAQVKTILRDRQLIADAHDPDRWEPLDPVPPSKSPRPDWMNKKGKPKKGG